MFPRDTYKINDNTVRQYFADANKGPIFFQAYTSDKGEDNQLKLWERYGDFINSVGDINVIRHGQGILQTANILKAGGRVYGVRLTDTEAVNANIVAMANIKLTSTHATDIDGNLLYVAADGTITTEAGDNSPHMLQTATVKNTLKTFANPTTNYNDLQALIGSLYREPASAEDYYEIPLFVLVASGRGVYGNNLRFRISNNYKAERNNASRLYNFELMENDGGLSQVGPTLSLGMNPDAVDLGGRSSYMDDVVKTNYTDIVAEACDESYYRITKLLLPVLQQENPNTKASDIDFISYTAREGNAYKNITRSDDHINFNIREGIGFQNGNDGRFDRANPDRADAVNEALIRLFKGQTVPMLDNSNEITFTAAFDAAYPLEVKKAMYELLERRKGDFHLYLDGSFIYNSANAISYLASELAFISTEMERHVTAGVMNFDTRDSYTGKIVPVTENYLHSKMLPEHIIVSGGPHKPLAGVNYPLNGDIIEGSLRPALSQTDEDTIYDLGGNIIHKRSGKYIFATNITYQKIDSELGYTNNVLVLNNMLKDLKGLSELFKFQFNDDEEDYNALNRMAQLIVAPYTDVQCKNAQAIVMPNPNDITNKSVITKVSVGFRSFILNNHTEIDINF